MINGKAVKGATGYWIAKETRVGSRYISFDSECYRVVFEKLHESQYSEVIQRHLGTLISDNTPKEVIDKCLWELCNSKIGFHFARTGNDVFKILSKIN